jgi:hypothetical protein
LSDPFIDLGNGDATRSKNGSKRFLNATGTVKGSYSRVLTNGCSRSYGHWTGAGVDSIRSDRFPVVAPEFMATPKLP